VQRVRDGGRGAVRQQRLDLAGGAVGVLPDGGGCGGGCVDDEDSNWDEGAVALALLVGAVWGRGIVGMAGIGAWGAVLRLVAHLPAAADVDRDQPARAYQPRTKSNPIGTTHDARHGAQPAPARDGRRCLAADDGPPQVVLGSRRHPHHGVGPL